MSWATPSSLKKTEIEGRRGLNLYDTDHETPHSAPKLEVEQRTSRKRAKIDKPIVKVSKVSMISQFVHTRTLICL